MKLIKTTVFSACISFIRIASGFVAGKVIAIFTGPGGVALIGSFSNFIAIVLTFANGAINTGVVKYAAEYKDDADRLKKLISTSFKISVLCSAFTGLLLLLFASYLSSSLLGSVVFVDPIRMLGFTIILYSLNSMLISLLNGLGSIGVYTVVNTIGSICGLVLTCILVFYLKVKGALYALVLAQSIVFFVTLTLVVKSQWFSWSHFKLAFDTQLAKKLGHFSLMAIVTALTVPLSQIVLRNMLINKLGLNSAGYWQGIMRISDGYLMLITTSLSTYYLPKLSAIKDQLSLKQEILKGYKLMIPAVLFSCMLIYFLRFFIIKTLYTAEFLDMQQMFFWQLVGDFFKLTSWILAYLMLAKAMTKTYVVTEVVFSATYVLFGHVFVMYYGLQGIVIAFAVNSFIYLVTMVFIFRKLLFNPQV